MKTLLILFLPFYFTNIDFRCQSILVKENTVPKKKLQLVNRWYYGPCNSVIAIDDTVYFRSGGKTRIFDVSNQNNPNIFSTTKTSLKEIKDKKNWFNVKHAITKIDDHCLQIWNIKRNGKREKVGTLKIKKQIGKFFLFGKYIYVTSGIYKIQIFDISSVANPVLLSTFKTKSSVRSIRVKGEFAYILNAKDNLVIYDIGNPYSPFKISVVSIGGSLVDISEGESIINDDFLYLLGYWSGLSIIDISDPKHPKKIGALKVGRYSKIFIKDEIVFLSSLSKGLNFIDISDPYHPESIAHFEERKVYDFAVYNQIAYIACGSDGLLLLDLSNPFDPQIRERFEAGTISNDLMVSNSFIYISNKYKGFYVLDISDSTSYKQTFRFDTKKRINKLAIKDDLLYALEDGIGIHIFDKSEPSKPHKIGFLEEKGKLEDIYISDSKAYVANGRKGVMVVDLSNLSSLCIIDTITNLGNVKRIYFKNNYLYISGDNKVGFTVLDIKNIKLPRKVYSKRLSSVKELEVFEDFAFLVGGNRAVIIFDISNPESILYRKVFIKNIYKTLKKIGLKYISDIKLKSFTQNGLEDYKTIFNSSNYLFLTDRYNGLQVVDVTNPFNIKSLATYINKNTSLFGLDVIDSTVYMCGYSGIYALKYNFNYNNNSIDENESVEKKVVYFSQLLMQCNMQLEQVSYSIYDIFGREIKSVSNYNLNEIDNLIEWDGKTNLNKSVSDGVYFYSILGEENSIERTHFLFIN